MVKWIIKELELGQFYLQFILKYLLDHFQSHPKKTWALSLEYHIIPKYQYYRRSIAWNSVITTYKTICIEVTIDLFCASKTS